jgi:uncharacterized protein (TIGR02271 family)
MPMPTDLQTMIGRNAVDLDGSKIGKIGQIYVDDQTEQPVWVTVHTGMFGTKENFAPVYGSTVSGDNLVLAVTKDLVKDAPSVEADGHLEESENDALYRHYNGYLGSATYQRDEVYDVEGVAGNSGRDDVAGKPGIQGRDTSGPTTDDAMTRSEERLHVGTEKVETGRARLRKYIVTEDVAQTVTLAHDELRLEREPITDANRDQAMAGGDLTEEEHEITLTEERPVVVKETVPVERVRLATDTVTEQQKVNETLRKEQIEVDPAGKH